MALKQHIFLLGDEDSRNRQAIMFALLLHFPEYGQDCRERTRISMLVDDLKAIHDFVFEYQELFDNSYWRIVDLRGEKPQVSLHRPQYEGKRKDFVDIEWEFIIGYLSQPLLQNKLRLWANDPKQELGIAIAYHDSEKCDAIAGKLRQRLPESVKIEIREHNPEAEAKQNAELMEMAKYLNYFYQMCFDGKHVPTEFPEDEVNKAWEAIEDEKMKRSNIFNVMSIRLKMEILGHDRHDWDTFYALTAEEIERLTAVEHNRWCVERLIQGMRPCTDRERREIEEDMRKRLSDEEYARENPVSLKKKYKNERNAHYDLCAFSELGVDETGLPVTRYDRDLTAAIPLIVKTYNDRHGNG